MAKYHFSIEERWAVFSVYGQQCYICRCPLDFTSMEVDHIIPEALLEKPSELADVLTQFGLPADFELNSFGNWLPSCGSCNQIKGSSPFQPTLLFQRELTRAIKNAKMAAQMAKSAITNRQLSRALGVIAKSSGKEGLAPEAVAPLIASYLKVNPEVERLVKAELSTNSLAFTLASDTPALELRINPANTVVFASTGIQIVHGLYGAGYIPNGEKPDASFYCGHCGSIGPWSGGRCMTCGHFDDGD